MLKADYLALREAITAQGYGSDIEWAQTVSAPVNADSFANDYVFVVCNSGMKAQIAAQIFRKVMGALAAGAHPSTVFGHAGKANAMHAVWQARETWFARYLAIASTDGKIEFLGSMPWIGSITKWHLAKNLGLDTVKPDRHLVRVADRYGLTPHEMCARLAQETGDRLGTVDVVIWRACNIGLIRHAA